MHARHRAPRFGLVRARPLRHGVANRVAQPLAQDLAKSLANAVGELFANRIGHPRTDGFPDVLGIEPAAEHALLDDRRAHGRAQPLTQHLIEPLLDRARRFLADRFADALTDVLRNSLLKLLDHSAAAGAAAHLRAEASAREQLTLPGVAPRSGGALDHRRFQRRAETLAGRILDAPADDLA